MRRIVVLGLVAVLMTVVIIVSASPAFPDASVNDKACENEKSPKIIDEKAGPGGCVVVAGKSR